MKKHILRWLLPFSIATMSLSLFSCGQQEEAVDNAGGSAFYEIFVGSFSDSNGDGIGDLKGIEEKLDYLDDLGVSNLWLTPIHPSNTYHKYNVGDYYAVDSSFGTLEDFDSLAKAAKEKGIGIILDMVFNHAWSGSQWFKNFESAIAKRQTDSPYYDNFVITNEPKYGYTLFPSSGYVETNFDSSMPEFNWDSQYVRSEFKKIQDFWIDHGAAGFRYDAVKYFYCTNSNGNITGNDQKNFEAMKFLADSAKAKKADVYLVGENWVEDINNIAYLAGSGMNIFNFPTCGLTAAGSVGKMVTKGGQSQFTDAVQRHQTLLRAKRADADLCYFITNHDMDRWGSYRNGLKLAEEARKCMASAYLLTPGTPFMYYGEELSMLGSRASSDMTDAMRRQAMVWGEGDSHNCKQPEGFEVKEQTEDTVKKAQANPDSAYNHYKKVLKIRNSYKDLFRKGAFESLDLGQSRCCGFKITLNEEVYYLIHNANSSEETVSLPEVSQIAAELQTVKTAAKLAEGSLTLGAYSSALLK